MGTSHNRATAIDLALQAMPKTSHQQLQHEPPLITEAAAARRLGVSPQYLLKWRFLGRPALPFVRLGKRMIRYRPADIDALIQNRVVAPTAPHLRYDADPRTT